VGYRCGALCAGSGGGAVLDLSGQTLRYGLDRPVLNPEFVALGHRSLMALM